MSDILKKRGKALEEQFFTEKESEAIAQLRAAVKRNEAAEILRAETGLSDEAVSRVVDMGIGPDTYVALRLVPLVLVAWADQDLDQDEREAILVAAHQKGITAGSPSYSLLQDWLSEPPSPALKAAWCDFMEAYVPTLDASSKAELEQDLLKGTVDVAEAAGGFLGTSIGSVSDEEDELIAKLRGFFS